MTKVASSIPGAVKVLTDYKAMIMSFDWLKWLRLLAVESDKAPKAAVFSYDPTASSLPVTDLQGTYPLPSAGLYRVSYLLRITQAGSGDVGFSVNWAVDSVACSVSWSPLVGTVAGSVQSSSTVIQLDGTAVISIAASVSAGATLQYKLDVVLEEIGGQQQ